MKIVSKQCLKIAALVLGANHALSAFASDSASASATPGAKAILERANAVCESAEVDQPHLSAFEFGENLSILWMIDHPTASILGVPLRALQGNELRESLRESYPGATFYGGVGSEAIVAIRSLQDSTDHFEMVYPVNKPILCHVQTTATKDDSQLLMNTYYQLIDELSAADRFASFVAEDGIDFTLGGRSFSTFDEFKAGWLEPSLGALANIKHQILAISTPTVWNEDGSALEVCVQWQGTLKSGVTQAGKAVFAAGIVRDVNGLPRLKSYKLSASQKLCEGV